MIQGSAVQTEWMVRLRVDKAFLRVEHILRELFGWKQTNITTCEMVILF